MKKFIFILLLLITTNLSAVVVSHHKSKILVDNSSYTSLTRKDYHFKCKKCGSEFVISNMLYHENTDMYFYYKQCGGVKVLQPYENENICEKCYNKCYVITVGIGILIILLIIISARYFN